MLQPVDDASLPLQSGVSFVPGTAFAVTFSDSDGKAVQQLLTPATLSLAVRSGPSGQGARVYEISSNRVRPLPLASDSNGSVSAEIDTIAQYVIGVPAPTVAGTTQSINPFIIGGLGLIALLSAGLLISRGFQRRKTRFVPVRKPCHVPRALSLEPSNPIRTIQFCKRFVQPAVVATPKRRV